MKNLITCLVVCVLSGATFADTWTVDDDGKADFDNIQAAVDAASDGDEILVMPGTYIYTGSGDNNRPVVDIPHELFNVWIHSSDGPENTFIDGQNIRRCIAKGSNTNPIYEGFTIMNGFAPYGAGIYVYGPGNTSFIDCIITNNNTHNYGGGGCFINYGSNVLVADVLFTDCVFTNNSTNNAGGGILQDGPSAIVELTRCVIQGNTASGDGGGIRCSSTGGTTLIDTHVCENAPDQIYGSWIDGGGNTIAEDCTPCLADIALDDGQVNIHDLMLLIAVYGTSSELADLNGDGIVKIHDLLILINAWGPCE